MEWMALLEDYNIDYVTHGPNTKKGEVSIQCPFCGADDPSYHLGISLQTENWGCHRDPGHRGKAPHRLVKALLGCSSAQTQSIVAQYDRADPDTLDDMMKILTDLETDTSQAALLSNELKKWQFPSEFKNIRTFGITYRFHRYLQSRGFDYCSWNVDEVIRQYQLLCATTGRFKDRVIIPIYYRDELMGWTGRAITRVTEAPRYLSTDEAIKTVVYNYDELIRDKKPQRLFITEGPFDAIKVDYYGNQISSYQINQDVFHTRATATFGVNCTISQIILLRNLVSHYDSTYILFDPEARAQALELADWLGPTVKVGRIPGTAEDPGALSRGGVLRLCSGLYAMSN